MLDQITIQEFSQTLSQPLIMPFDPGYDEGRSVWNGMVDKRPVMIANCRNAEDIKKCVNFAQSHDLLVSIKGGGHNVAGKAVCDDGLMINLSQMNAVAVDPVKRTVRVESGATLGELDKETQKFGLATPVGIVSKTGIAGLTLGGGIGYLGRKHGLTIDNLLSVEIITAKGDLISANETENSDLFWALRGGGGNFGVVTSFEFKLHELGPEIMTAQIFYPIEDAKQVLKFYSEFTSSAAEELAGYALVVKVPPADPFPEALQGKIAIALVVSYAGSLDDGKTALEPLENFGNPILRVIMPMSYIALQTSFDKGAPKGMRYYWKAHYIDHLSDEAIDVFVNNTNHIPGELSVVGFEPFGGAITRVEESATAFPQRSASYVLGVWSGWMEAENDEKNINWTREFYNKMTPFASGGAYSNYLDNDDSDKIIASFGSNYSRLQDVKYKYDPNNFFKLNLNIIPKPDL
ncbi:FAD-binding oxidoreductase [Arenibacter sp. TNZ]|uniref:FAD-binding oxidoreductase n=1 Tax=Arenibacter TaxID=178469 RepID=UPI000CD3E18B|nr:MULTISPECIES: FAD-binding oxidoreductase [Arenibacter]MCM4173818.1 FAD-binding oxidoreductase [Arenibacter sp. TNZ]